MPALQIQNGVGYVKTNYSGTSDVTVWTSDKTWRAILKKDTGFIGALLTGSVRVNPAKIATLFKFLSFFDN